MKEISEFLEEVQVQDKYPSEGIVKFTHMIRKLRKFIVRTNIVSHEEENGSEDYFTQQQISNFQIAYQNKKRKRNNLLSNFIDDIVRRCQIRFQSRLI